MTERLVAAIPAESSQVLPARLEPDAIGAAQDTIIGMANSAPTVAIGLSLAGLAAAAAYGQILMPGEPEHRSRIARLRDGIPLDATTWKQLETVARSLGIPGHDV